VGGPPAGGLHWRKGAPPPAAPRTTSYGPSAACLGAEPSEPNLEEARRFAAEVHARFPGKLLAYNCSPSFNWKKKLDGDTIRRFQSELGKMGYKFQFVTLAGFHAPNPRIVALAPGHKGAGEAA